MEPKRAIDPDEGDAPTPQPPPAVSEPEQDV